MRRLGTTSLDSRRGRMLYDRLGLAEGVSKWDDVLFATAGDKARFQMGYAIPSLQAYAAADRALVTNEIIHPWCGT